MNKIEKVIELYKNGNSTSDIAKIVDLTGQRIGQILKKEGFRETNFNYSPKITEDLSTKITKMCQEGLTPTEISAVINITAPGIRNFLKKKGIKPNKKTIDRSRPCVMCGKLFIPIHHDGVKKDKYKTCSEECLSTHLSKIKTKIKEN